MPSFAHAESLSKYFPSTLRPCFSTAALNVLLFELSKWKGLSFGPASFAKLVCTQLINKEINFIWPKELEQAFEDQ